MLNKVITIVFFSTILIGNVGFCAETNPTTTTNTSYDYNFDENSFNISDEQFKEAQEIEQDNEKQTFTSKVINSSHFSPSTATKTWIPFRKNND